jgi:predicted transcriptional regulator
MISNPKPTASLSSSLLARKGHARPAMRPQGFLQLSTATAQDDLGWNDMGEAAMAAAQAPAPQPVDPQIAAEAPKPAVLREREALDERLAAPQPEVAELAPAPEPAPVEAAAAPLPELTPISDGVLARVVRAVSTKKAKAAFTLRLDQERHLKLRLASAVSHRSCQHLVTEALDQFLDSFGEVDALARQLAAKDRG